MRELSTQFAAIAECDFSACWEPESTVNDELRRSLVKLDVFESKRIAQSVFQGRHSWSKPC